MDQTGAPSTPTLAHDPDDPEEPVGGARVGTRRWITALHVGPAACAQALERHWRKLWEREVRAPLPEEWQAALDGLPTFPRRTEWN
eukprot:2295413-Lingulodinium_polyedra.AAC.1